jgi:hypothetical protein
MRSKHPTCQILCLPGATAQGPNGLSGPPKVTLEGTGFTSHNRAASENLPQNGADMADST